MGPFLMDFSRRATTPELMDDPDVAEADVRAALADLRRINRYLGVTATLGDYLLALIHRHRFTNVTVLDVGTGSADIPQALVRRARAEGLGLRVIALDRGRTVLKIARQHIAGDPDIWFVQADAQALPFADGSVDFAIASEFLHHLDTDEACVFLRRLHDVVRVAFIVHDLRRHPLAYYGFGVLTRFFFRSRLVRHDGPVSFLRGFAAEDLRWLREWSGLPRLSFHCHFPYRLVIVGEK